MIIGNSLREICKYGSVDYEVTLIPRRAMGMSELRSEMRLAIVHIWGIANCLGVDERLVDIILGAMMIDTMRAFNYNLAILEDAALAQGGVYIPE